MTVDRKGILIHLHFLKTQSFFINGQSFYINGRLNMSTENITIISSMRKKLCHM
jgi:hypothetical protein